MNSSQEYRPSHRNAVNSINPNTFSEPCLTKSQARTFGTAEYYNRLVIEEIYTQLFLILRSYTEKSFAQRVFIKVTKTPRKFWIQIETKTFDQCHSLLSEVVKPAPLELVDGVVTKL